MLKYLSIGLAAVLFAAVILIHGRQSTQDRRSVALYEQLIASCRVVEEGPFEDSMMGFRFQVREGLVACDRREQSLPGKREVYILRKASLSDPMPLGQGIVGKVSVNQHPGLPSGVVIGEENGMVAGTFAKIRIMQPPACGTGSCPLRVRGAELDHAGNKFLIEEYAPGIGLLDTFAFTRATPQSL